MFTKVKDAVDIFHLREMAKRRLPKALFNALDHGSEDDVSYHHNRDILERLKLVHRVLCDVSNRSAKVNLFGKEHDYPFIIGPTGITSWLSYQGELSLARAAAQANIPFVLTSTTDTPMETVRQRGGGTQWYQSIIWRDTEATLQGILRAREAGFDGLILTVDSTIPYNRPYDQRQRLTFPMNLRPSNLLEAIRHPSWTFSTPMRYLLGNGELPRMTNTVVPESLTREERQKFFVKDDSLTWDFVQRIRELWSGTFIIKGILHPEDAIKAAEYGADGVVVSNHGGGTNDAAPAPIEMLPAVAAAVKGRTTILVDSGFRRGSDVIKALALGADAVMLGRATLYGLGAGGQAGASRAVSTMGNEIQRMMGVLGVTKVSELGPDHVVIPSDLNHLRRPSDEGKLWEQAVNGLNENSDVAGIANLASRNP